MELFYKLLNLFGFGILFLFAIRRAYEEEGVSVHLRNYSKLTEQEKMRYDISKIKKTEILFLILFYVLYAVGVWGWSQSNKSMIFIIMIAFMISSILIFTRTKIILDLFCKKKFDHK